MSIEVVIWLIIYGSVVTVGSAVLYGPSIRSWIKRWRK